MVSAEVGIVVEDSSALRAGEVVKGRVRVKVDEPVELQSIQVELRINDRVVETQSIEGGAASPEAWQSFPFAIALPRGVWTFPETFAFSLVAKVALPRALDADCERGIAVLPPRERLHVVAENLAPLPRVAGASTAALPAGNALTSASGSAPVPWRDGAIVALGGSLAAAGLAATIGFSTPFWLLPTGVAAALGAKHFPPVWRAATSALTRRRLGAVVVEYREVDDEKPALLVRCHVEQGLESGLVTATLRVVKGAWEDANAGLGRFVGEPVPLRPLDARRETFEGTVPLPPPDIPRGDPRADTLQWLLLVHVNEPFELGWQRVIALEVE